MKQCFSFVLWSDDTSNNYQVCLEVVPLRQQYVFLHATNLFELLPWGKKRANSNVRLHVSADSLLFDHVQWKCRVRVSGWGADTHANKNTDTLKREQHKGETAWGNTCHLKSATQTVSNVRENKRNHRLHQIEERLLKTKEQMRFLADKEMGWGSGGARFFFAWSRLPSWKTKRPRQGPDVTHCTTHPPNSPISCLFCCDVTSQLGMSRPHPTLPSACPPSPLSHDSLDTGSPLRIETVKWSTY